MTMLSQMLDKRWQDMVVTLSSNSKVKFCCRVDLNSWKLTGEVFQKKKKKDLRELKLSPCQTFLCTLFCDYYFFFAAGEYLKQLTIT